MNMPIQRALLCAAVLLPAVATAAPLSLRVDDTRYFASATAEADARTQLLHKIQALQDDTRAAPAQRFRQAEALYGCCLRHRAYLELQTSRDRNDVQASTAMDAVSDACGDDAALARTLAREAPADAIWAAPYRYFVQRGQSRAPQAAAEGAGTAIDRLAAPALSSFNRLYRDLRQSGRYEQIAWQGRPLDAGKDAALLATAPDRAVRERAWRARWAGMAGPA
ncbi:MAG: hypothetical protein GAK31_03980 [Stenotrophomonas maltophilia]|uniref:Uncharacterized protein n=1 Tax=Stenotrophomonas maltophilia TaxID=40324 RepID=A0A7V8JJU0_STEMA|nr:MAG: hypothetical protein GAK31_03980 [Stenotrophomonas maltophilia]